MPTNNLMALQNKHASTIAALRALAAAAGDTDLSAEDQAKYDELKAEVSTIKGQMEREQELINMESTVAVVNQNTAAVENTVTITGGEDRLVHDPKRGFAHYGEFCMAVHAAGKPGAHVDDRLLIGAAPTTYGNEGAGADGAFAIPPQFSSNIRDLATEEDAILPMTDNDPISGNSMAYPTDETTAWGTDGIRAYWEGEADQATQTKPKLGLKTLRLRKLIALVPMTDELMSDAPALGSHLTKKTGESIRFKTNDSFFVGDGSGTPLGIANAGSLVTQAKETSQTADTINATNLAKMYARQLNPTRAVWHLNPDAFPQLPLLTISNQPVWTAPGNGFTNAPGGLLLGRPVFFNESCTTVGDLGDIYFADWMGYKTITKQGGIDFATSIHLYFDYDVQAFRAIFRVDGAPSLAAAVSPKNGATTRSCFVTLAART